MVKTKDNYIFKLSNTIVSDPTFVIGIDTCDEKYAYCLVRCIDKKKEVILVKTMNNKKEFEKEVDNISKYFNAEKIVEQ